MTDIPRGYATLLNAPENFPHVNLAAGCSVEPTPTSPLSTSGSPAQLSATRRKLQRHGRICRTQKFRRLTRGASPIFRPDAPPLHRRDGERRLSHLRTIAGQQRKTKRVHYAKSWQCETGTSAGELRAEPRAMRLVNHPFRLDSQRLLSYLTSMRVLTLAVTPAISTTFWNTIYFYTASATAGNLSYDCARGRHCTVSAAASRRHVDASLDLFTRKSPRIWRDLSEKRALSARRLIFVDGGSIN